MQKLVVTARKVATGGWALRAGEKAPEGVVTAFATAPQTQSYPIYITSLHPQRGRIGMQGTSEWVGGGDKDGETKKFTISSPSPFISSVEIGSHVSTQCDIKGFTLYLSDPPLRLSVFGGWG